jgi:quercetin dioxygenase-like cupin family protein
LTASASRYSKQSAREEIMKIRVRDHAVLSNEKMAKIGLATTDRTQLDLYCVAPGQSQKPHTHTGEDKIYYVLEGSGRFTLGGREEQLSAGEAMVAASGVEHGLTNDGSEPLLVLVVMSPPPPHGPAAGHGGAAPR